MKKTFLILLLIFVFGVSIASASVLTFNKKYEGQGITIKFYNGQLDTQSAQVVVITDGGGTHNFSIDVEAEGPSGGYDKHEIGWARPGERNKYDIPLIFVVHPEDEKPGTGHVRILAGGDEILYLEFAYDGRNIRFGESYKPEPKVEIIVPEISIPREEPKPREEQKETSNSSVFNITSIPSPADLHVDGNWVGNTPATVELPFGQHKIVVKKKGYKDWEKELNVSMKGKFSLCAELEKMSKEEIAAASRKIVFSSDKLENGIWKHNIYIMNADGSDVKRLTHSAGDSEPSVSPDGKKIAFISRRDKNNSNKTQVYIMDINGSNVRRLTNSNEIECTPRWSPDGKKIAFVVIYSGNTEIYVANADGSDLRRLTNNTCWDDQPSWSPDSKKIVFASGNYLSDPAGHYDICVINADGSGLKRLTNLPVNDLNPSWSPDGKKIAFVSSTGKKATPIGGYVALSEIYVMNADGTGIERLTNAATGDDSCSEPSWSPDGKQIAFESARDGKRGVYVMDADGSNVRRLTNNPGIDSSPCWCPDGKQITFLSARDGNTEIYVMDADGSNVRRLTNNPGIDSSPCWCPIL